MKSFLLIFVIIGFTGIATFGVFAMNHVDAQNHSQGCATSAISGLVCVKGISGFDFASLHLSIFRNIFAASSKYNVSMVLLFALGALLLGYGVFSKSANRRTAGKAKRSWRQFFAPSFSPQKQELISWLAFHETSPTVI